MEESVPVFYCKGMFQFEHGGVMVGAVVTVAEDLAEAFYYPLIGHGQDSSLGIVAATGTPGTDRFHSAQENALNLFWQRRCNMRAEVGFYDRMISRDRQPQCDGGMKIRGRINQRSWPRFRYCGSLQQCVCWYDKPVAKGRKTIIAAFDGEEKATEISYDLRDKFRWRDYFEQQCELCLEWSRSGVACLTFNGVNYYAHIDCMKPSLCFCGLAGVHGRFNGTRSVWSCEQHKGGL